MTALWRRPEIVILAWAYLTRTTYGETADDIQLKRVHAGEPVTLIWTIPNVTLVEKVVIRDENYNDVIRFQFWTLANKLPFVEEIGDGRNTFGFTIQNVKLRHAGVYRCKYNGTEWGQRICFVWETPENAKVTQVGGRLNCDANPTSLPAASRPPQDSMKFYWYSRDEHSPNTTPKYTSADPDTRNIPDQTFITLTLADQGYMFCCAGSENGSSLWSEPSDLYKPNFPTVKGALWDPVLAELWCSLSSLLKRKKLF